MEIDEIILIVALIFLVAGLGGWRIGVISIGKGKIFHAISGVDKTSKNVEEVNTKQIVSAGSYVITVTNPQVGEEYKTEDPASGITVVLTVPAPDKFSVNVIGTRGDLHSFTVQLPHGCKYYYEEYYIDEVSMKGVKGIRGLGVTKNTKVKVSFLYRVLGKDETVIVIFKPYADFS